LLRELVLATDQTTHELLSWYLETVSDLSKKAEAAWRSRVSEARSAVYNPMEFVRNLLGVEPQPPGNSAEIEELRRQVRDLESRLARRGRRKPAPKKRK
jgi:hypothetical protein